MIRIRHLEIGELKKVSNNITEVVTGRLTQKVEKIDKDKDIMIINGDGGFELKGTVTEVCQKLKQMMVDDAGLKFVNFKDDDITGDIQKLVDLYA